MIYPHISDLVSLGIIDPSKARLFHQGTRDDPEIQVWRCDASGVIYLDQVVPPKVDRYAARPSITTAAKSRDNTRRRNALRNSLYKATWVDVGSGGGGLIYAVQLMYLVEPWCKKIWAVEPDIQATEGYKDLAQVVPDIIAVPNGTVDVVTMMHVVEHLAEPLHTLRSAYHKLRPGGKLYLETPNANDLLIEYCKAFRAHTFWSEHLVLYTAGALKDLVSAAGFTQVTCNHFQRYGLGNHLGWFLKGKPGGQVEFRRPELATDSSEYGNTLCRYGKSDTLWVEAVKE